MNGACNFGLRKKRECSFYVEKTKALISAFIFAYTKNIFFHDAALDTDIKLNLSLFCFVCFVLIKV